MRKLLLAAVPVLAIAQAQAQTAPGFATGGAPKVPTPAQWDSYFAKKQDYPLAMGFCGALQWTPGVGIGCNYGLANSQGVATALTTADDTTTSTTYYPVFVTAVAGIGLPKTSSTKLTWNPSSGVMTVGGLTVPSAGIGIGIGVGNYWLGLAAGAASFPPIQLTAGGPMTTPTGGAIEYDGNAFYLTPQAGNRAVTVNENLCALSGDFGLTNGTATQQALNCSASGQVTLAASTSYEFEAEYMITNTGTNSHTWAVAFGGGASLAAITYDAIAVSATGAATPTAANQLWNNTAAATAVTTASTSATENVTIRLRGLARVTSGGTFVPQIKLSAAPGGVQAMKAGSFFRLWAVGSNAVTTIGNWN